MVSNNVGGFFNDVKEVVRHGLVAVLEMLPHLGILLENIVVDCLQCLVVVFVKADKISMEVLEYMNMYDVYDVYGRYFVNGGEQKIIYPSE